MAKLINKDGCVVSEFEGEAGLFSYILETVNAPGTEGMRDWRFTYSSHKQLEGFIEKMGGKRLAYMTCKAHQQGRDLITLATGDGQNPSFLIVTPDLNVAALRRQWCKQYCASHGLRIVNG